MPLVVDAERILNVDQVIIGHALDRWLLGHDRTDETRQRATSRAVEVCALEVAGIAV